MYSIYKLISPEEKVYIGITKQEKLYRRWQYGAGYANNSSLYQDILKFGWNNFKHEIIETTETEEEAFLKEREAILKYKSNLPEFGYNKHTNSSRNEQLYSYVQCVETGELFESGAEVARVIGRTTSAVSYAIKNNKPCAGRHWVRVKLPRQKG